MENNPWKDAIINAMKSYNMDITLYSERPDDAVCDLLYMHANAETHEAILAYEASRGEPDALITIAQDNPGNSIGEILQEWSKEASKNENHN